MGGIVGFSSHTQGACRPLVNGLRRLEYRGYDSVGLNLPPRELATSRRAVTSQVSLEILRVAT